jgi:hypothetical protein
MPSRSKKIAREVAKLPSIPKELVSLPDGTDDGRGDQRGWAGVEEGFGRGFVERRAEPPSRLRGGADRPELVTNQATAARPNRS